MLGRVCGGYKFPATSLLSETARACYLCWTECVGLILKALQVSRLLSYLLNPFSFCFCEQELGDSSLSSTVDTAVGVVIHQTRNEELKQFLSVTNIAQVISIHLRHMKQI
jgi:hypothetical protein